MVVNSYELFPGLIIVNDGCLMIVSVTQVHNDNVYEFTVLDSRDQIIRKGKLPASQPFLCEATIQ